MRQPSGAREGDRVGLRVLFVGIATLMACAASQQPQDTVVPAADGPAVLVGKEEVVAVFPRAIGSEMAWPAGRVASRWTMDQWRLMIPLEARWLVAAHQLVVDSSLVVQARSSTEAAVAAGQFVNCDLQTHVITCGQPLRGSVNVVNGEVVFHILDSRWGRALRGEHPRSARLLFVRGGQEVIWEGVVDIDYQ
jgi:hypothetical protein